MTDLDIANLVRLDQLVAQRPYLSERWVRTLVASGALPHHKLGGRLLFNLAEVDAIVAANRTEAREEPRSRRRRRR